MLPYSVVIPTNRPFEAISPLLYSLVTQTHIPNQIVVVYDVSSLPQIEQYTKDITYFFSHYPSIIVALVTELSWLFVAHQGASYVRNSGRALATNDFLLFVDDDNVLDSQVIEQLAEYWTDPSSRQHDAIVVPVQYDGDSDSIRNAAATGFNYLLCRPKRVLSVLYPDRYQPLQFASSNCLFGPRYTFDRFPFDESVPFVYEDLLMTRQMSTHGVSLVYDTNTAVHHYHHHTSRLGELYIDTPVRAYYKSKHRIVLVKHIWSIVNRFWFFVFGLRGHTVRLLVNIVRYAPINRRYRLIHGIAQGTRDGLVS